MMAELDPLSWREKLEVLKRLPKPAKASPYPSPSVTPHSEDNINNTIYGSPNVAAHRRGAKDMLKFKLYNQRDEDPYMPVKNSAEVYDLCGYNDLLNPCISTEERFDRYMLELERMEETKEGKSQSIATNFLPDLTPQDHARARNITPENYWDKKYDLRGKGGGWRILPKIERAKDDSQMPTRLSLACVSFDKEEPRTLGRGHNTAR